MCQSVKDFDKTDCAIKIMKLTLHIQKDKHNKNGTNNAWIFKENFYCTNFDSFTDRVMYTFKYRQTNLHKGHMLVHRNAPR